ncbi:MAG: hypothetical protein H0W06_01135 [Chloroflexia bacterium]|nr:hypothetical protein [Chloroflexia bacterium]
MRSSETETNDATGSVLDVLASLIDAGLLRTDSNSEDHGTARFQMLETIREFGIERLIDAGEAEEARRDHAAYFLALAEEAEGHLHGPEQAVWIARLHRELDNFRASLTWAEANAAVWPDLGIRLSAALWLFWAKHGQPKEGRQWLERALVTGEYAPAGIRAKALMGAGTLAGWQNNLTDQAARFEAALALWREEGNTFGVGRALFQLGAVANERGDYRRAVSLMREALPLHRQVGDEPYAALALTVIGWARCHLGERPRGLALAERGLAGELAIGEAWGAQLARMALATLLLDEAETQRAAALYGEMLAEATPDDLISRMAAYAGLALVALKRGQSRRAATLTGAVEAMRTDVGISLLFGLRDRFEAALPRIREALGEPEFTAAWTAGGELPADHVSAEAHAVVAAIPEATPAPSGPPPTPASPAGLPQLSPREREVLRLMAGGLTNQQIADCLFVSRRTVTTHATNILTKLGLESRTAAVAFAIRHDLA